MQLIREKLHKQKQNGCQNFETHRNGQPINQLSIQQKALAGSGVITLLAIAAIPSMNAYTRCQNSGYSEFRSICCREPVSYHNNDSFP